MPNTSQQPRYHETRERLNLALASYHDKREELLSVDDDEEANVFIVGSNIPSVLRELADAANMHADVMERKMDAIYMSDMFDE